MTADEPDLIIAALTPVVDGIAATLGSFCEVVVHDFRRPGNSVVALAGSVTGRRVGSSMSGIGRGLLARGDAAQDELNHTTRIGNGKLVRSSTMLLRDSTGSVFGALCVNVDITAVGQAHALLGELAGAGPAAGPATTSFGGDIASVVDAIVDAHQLRQHKQWSALGRGERLALFRSLDESGVFAVRGAAQQVAERLGISRASAYSYLARARSATGTSDEPGPAGGTRPAAPGQNGAPA
ncbi:helix-turn-helix transcriptional regulator [Streptomyces tropicalis]|uniref:PAS domain-containing protein n=1 Tax=Streptomyces tropicalis TaxID=3034234 RepID=A0ABT6A444_9ACTN|nr:PAS domain-containing protein [Streptomyces tropicalis]MDF3299166.1 PAS domain-containing protein [Streptomyces tropicalis]